ncbi:MAG: tRNA preQ1(34) S-adenosylmethionine ribosyltransferase-isomerase QueA [Planctomycetaceae bacterium]|nr:tRNA preQ1(34) S-adenosylmethionine ribosyltransferase-isomerase QueA [Planctomycetaceae bacterium]MCB9952992.1 tRNA preQ1(34) S-adenosylmethionine ribosyltransferase-isomerase QueA [Planctomycetaceae bacterium]
MTHDDSVDLYQFDLPEELIAQVPVEPRDESRLLVVDRATGSLQHKQFRDLPEFLSPGDLLVVNETRVVRARLTGIRTNTGGRWEGLFLREESPGVWRIIGSTRGKLLPGETITLQSSALAGSADTVTLRLLSREEGGEWLAEPQSDTPTLDLLEGFGDIPLPPYMQRDSQTSDIQRYQTTYAKTPGAVAAPTAGLHFTPELFEAIREKGIDIAAVTLHVGLGTFRPVAVDRLSEHQMHAEWCELSEETVRKINETRQRGGRVIAVGTTTVRTLESVASQGELRPWSGMTSIFIKPPYDFKVVDQLITNFHLPKSTLLVLVSAFASRDQILSAYQAAIEEKYRFYSYGDAMLIQ